MRRSALLATFCLLLAAAAHGQPAPELEYDAEAPLKLPPDLYLGENAGVAVDSRGHVFVYTRSGTDATIIAPRAASLYELAPDGSFVREIGGNLYCASSAGCSPGGAPSRSASGRRRKNLAAWQARKTATRAVSARRRQFYVDHYP